MERGGLGFSVLFLHGDDVGSEELVWRLTYKEACSAWRQIVAHLVLSCSSCCSIIPSDWLASANIEETGDALHNVRSNLVDPNNVLQSWDPTLVNQYTWFHVTCNTDTSVIRVDMGNADLSGSLFLQLGVLKSLQCLDHGNLTNLVSLDLYLNSFSGPIPDSLDRLLKLRFLDLSKNRLPGVVPDNGSFSLFTSISFANNLNLCGPVTGRPCRGSPLSPPPPFIPPPPVPTPGGYGIIEAIAGGVAAGAAFLFAAPAIVFAWWQRRKSLEIFSDVPDAC